MLEYSIKYNYNSIFFDVTKVIIKFNNNRCSKKYSTNHYTVKGVSFKYLKIIYV